MKNIEMEIERKKLQDAYLDFLNERECFQSPSEFPLSYDLCELIREKKWKIPFIEIKISGELRETINLLNFWRYNLINWEIWLNVLEKEKYNEHDAWLISYNLIENIAFFCMFQPSSTRDRFGFIATNAIHHVNLSIDSKYKDFLDQDKKKNNNPLKRLECEKQLNRLGNKFSSYTTFEQRLYAMDSSKYRKNTYDFRNSSSHKIAPRFESGHTDFIKRSIVPKSELVQQSDGSYSLIEDHTHKVVSYGIGFTSPLNFRKTQKINEEECMLAISTFNAYQDLLKELISNLQSQ